MIYEERTYALKAGAVPRWYELYQEKGLEVQKRILGNLVGYFMTEIGTLNQIVHIWAYDSMDDRAKRRAALYQDAKWLEFVAAVGKEGLIVKMENRILIPAPFSPLK